MPKLSKRRKIQGSPFVLAAKIYELESSLEMEKKFQMHVFDIVYEMKSISYWYFKALQQERESRIKDCEACDDWVAELRKKVGVSLQQALKKVYGPSISSWPDGKASPKHLFSLLEAKLIQGCLGRGFGR